jgi:hypothetical protein
VRSSLVTPCIYSHYNVITLHLCMRPSVQIRLTVDNECGDGNGPRIGVATIGDGEPATGSCRGPSCEDSGPL